MSEYEKMLQERREAEERDRRFRLGKPTAADLAGQDYDSTRPDSGEFSLGSLLSDPSDEIDEDERTPYDD